MQIYCSIIVAFLVFSTQLSANAEDQILMDADSLFAEKKYTQALQLYDSLLTMGYTSPQMTLKMAFIHEGLDHIPETMFFLNQYHAQSYDENALNKMEKLAETYNLTGYNVNDESLLLNILLKNRILLMQISGFSALALLMLSLILFIRKKPAGPTSSLTLVLTILFMLFFNSQLLSSKEGVAMQNSFMMRAPSAASGIVRTIPQATKIHILKENNVWCKIAIADTVGYIRRHQVRIINKI